MAPQTYPVWLYVTESIILLKYPPILLLNKIQGCAGDFVTKSPIVDLRLTKSLLVGIDFVRKVDAGWVQLAYDRKRKKDRCRFGYSLKNNK